MTESPEITCEKCKKPTYRVITGGGGFKLVGEGWHQGGFHSKSKGSNRKSDLRDHLDQVKEQGIKDAEAGRDKNTPRSKSR